MRRRHCRSQRTRTTSKSHISVGILCGLAGWKGRTATRRQGHPISTLRLLMRSLPSSTLLGVWCACSPDAVNSALSSPPPPLLPPSH